MSRKSNKASRDAFAFNLRGASTINAFVAPPAVPDDRINRILDDRQRPARTDARQPGSDTAPLWERAWLNLRRRFAWFAGRLPAPSNARPGSKG